LTFKIISFKLFHSCESVCIYIFSNHIPYSKTEIRRKKVKLKHYIVTEDIACRLDCNKALWNDYAINLLTCWEIDSCPVLRDWLIELSIQYTPLRIFNARFVFNFEDSLRLKAMTFSFFSPQKQSDCRNEDIVQTERCWSHFGIIRLISLFYCLWL
jgi:hypothetical protein